MSEPIAVPVVETQEVEVFAKTDNPSFTTTDDNSNQLSYKATHGVPFIIDYLGIRDFYEVSPEITKVARELHEWLSPNDNDSTITEMKLRLEELEGELNIHKEDSGIYKLKKLHSLVAIKNRIQELETSKLKALAFSNNM